MSLRQTLQVKEIAFEWGAGPTLRRYANDKLIVEPVEDKEVFKFSAGVYGQSVEGVWLEFEIAMTTLELIEPTTALTSNGIIALLNALNDPTETVTFYPIYSVDQSVSYEVIKPGARYSLLETQRSMFKPSANVVLYAVNRLDELPTWLETVRLY